MTNDEWIKRGLIAYVAMTVSLWLMTFTMEDNGAVSLRNPALVLVSGLRDLLTWAAIAVLTMTAIVGIAFLLLERRREEFEREESRKRQTEKQERSLRCTFQIRINDS